MLSFVPLCVCVFENKYILKNIVGKGGGNIIYFPRPDEDFCWNNRYYCSTTQCLKHAVGAS